MACEQDMPIAAEEELFLARVELDEGSGLKVNATTSDVTQGTADLYDAVEHAEDEEMHHDQRSNSVISTARTGAKRRLDELDHHDDMDPWEYMCALDAESAGLDFGSCSAEESGSINTAHRNHMAAAFEKYYPNSARLDDKPPVTKKIAALATNHGGKCETAAANHHSEEAESTVPEPSRFCHICTKSSRMVRQAVCCNLLSGVCRKVICEKCFEDNEWDFELAVSEDSGWVCSHCAGVCPDRAQCTFYRKANKKVQVKRKEQRRVARIQRLAMQSGTSSPTPSLSNDTKTLSKKSDQSESASNTALNFSNIVGQPGQQNWMTMALAAAAQASQSIPSTMFDPAAGSLDSLAGPQNIPDGQVNMNAIMQQMCGMLPFLAAQQMMMYTKNMQRRD